MMIEVKAGSAMTVLNGIILGKGSAIGTEPINTVRIQPADTLVIETIPILTDHRLISSVINEFQNYTGTTVDDIRIQTEAPIPPARGLKTSSSISCALLSALSKFYNTDISVTKIIEMSAAASINAQVSITGAVDDAYASFLGGYHVTDNLNRELIRTNQLTDTFDVLFLIPDEFTPKENLKLDHDYFDEYLLTKAYKQALQGDFIDAISINSRVYGQYLLDDFQVINELEDLLQLPVGLNGAGPSLFVINTDNRYDILDILADNFPKYSLFITKTRGVNNQ